MVHEELEGQGGVRSGGIGSEYSGTRDPALNNMKYTSAAPGSLKNEIRVMSGGIWLLGA